MCEAPHQPWRWGWGEARHLRALRKKSWAGGGGGIPGEQVKDPPNPILLLIFTPLTGHITLIFSLTLHHPFTPSSLPHRCPKMLILQELLF